MLRVLVLALLCACAGAVPNKRQFVKEVLPGIGSYYYHNIPMNWTDAAQYCREQRDSHLAYPESQEEANLLNELMSTNRVAYIHAGFHDMFVEGQYYTVTGGRVSQSCFKNWYTQSNTRDKNCGALYYARLMDIACSTKYTFFCVNNNYFKEDFDYIPGHGYYRMHRARRTWMDAQQTCEAESANLLVLNSEAELSALTARYGQFIAWVGVHHQFDNWQFVTIHDEPLNSTGFARWQNNQPSGTNDQNPYLIINSSVGYGLAIKRSTDVFSFICKHRPTVTELRAPPM